MRKSDEINLLTTRWWTYSALGVIMMAAGLITLGEAVFMRVTGKELAQWIWVMLIAVVIFNAGISFIGTSLKYRIYLDRRRKQESELHVSGTQSSSHHRHRSSSSRSSGSSHRRSERSHSED